MWVYVVTKRNIWYPLSTGALVFSRNLKGADDQQIDYGPEVPQAWQSKFDFQYESNESQHQTNSENFLNL